MQQGTGYCQNYTRITSSPTAASPPTARFFYWRDVRRHGTGRRVFEARIHTPGLKTLLPGQSGLTAPHITRACASKECWRCDYLEKLRRSPTRRHVHLPRKPSAFSRRIRVAKLHAEALGLNSEPVRAELHRNRACGAERSPALAQLLWTEGRIPPYRCMARGEGSGGSGKGGASRPSASGFPALNSCINWAGACEVDAAHNAPEPFSLQP